MGYSRKELPPLAYEHMDGPQSQICLARMGMNTYVASWVPDYTITGMVVRHGEAFSITEKLSVRDNATQQFIALRCTMPIALVMQPSPVFVSFAATTMNSNHGPAS